MGADGYRKGWVAVRLHDGTFIDAATFPKFTVLLEEFKTAQVIAVDIPIGLPKGGRRQADVEAHHVLGPRRNSVFWTPIRTVLEAPSYTLAREVARQLGVEGLSAQTYALRIRILELDAIAEKGDRIVEVHPEVSFWAMAGRHLTHPKWTWNGLFERVELLKAVGIVIPRKLGQAGEVGAEDLLDAAAAAWSASRVATGQAKSLPDDPPVDEKDRRVAIWF